MSQKANDIVSQTLEYIQVLFSDQVSTDYGYHNLAHTLSVLESVREIGAACRLSEQELEVLELAALFHDAGYSVTHIDHESRGAKMAYDYLIEQQYNADLAERVSNCIRSTDIKIEPQNLLEEILCDADLSYLGTTDFFQNVAQLRLEWEVTLPSAYNDAEWRQVNINFFERHRFYTSYAQERYGQLKQKHLAIWREAS